MRKHSDPWAPMPGFEPYAGPATDEIQLDTQTVDLRTFLRSEAQPQRPREATEVVRLPDGRAAQLSDRGNYWELAIHVGRDWYQIITGTSREQVLRLTDHL
jgi:hypothetical protein